MAAASANTAGAAIATVVVRLIASLLSRSSVENKYPKISVKNYMSYETHRDVGRGRGVGRWLASGATASSWRHRARCRGRAKSRTRCPSWRRW